MKPPDATGRDELAELLRDWRLSECEHAATTIAMSPLAGPVMCSPCLRDRVLTSAWFNTRLAEAERRGAEKAWDSCGNDGQCWIPVFIAWADGVTDTLDLEGRELPPRLQQLLTALEPGYHVLTVRGDGWNIQHPLPCRPNLGDCSYNGILDAKRLDGLFAQAGPSRWKVEERDNGEPHLTLLGVAR